MELTFADAGGTSQPLVINYISGHRTFRGRSLLMSRTGKSCMWRIRFRLHFVVKCETTSLDFMELHHRNKTVRLALLNDAEYTDFGQRHLVNMCGSSMNAGEWPATEARAGAKHSRGYCRIRCATPGVSFQGGRFPRRTCWLVVGCAAAGVFEEPQDKQWLNQIAVEETATPRQGYGLAMLAAA